MLAVVLAFCMSGGCRINDPCEVCFDQPLDLSHDGGLLHFDEPDIVPCAPMPPEPSPNIIDEKSIQPGQTWNLTLQECIDYALRNSRVMRDLGGTVLRSPAAVSTVYGPAEAYTNPLFGVERALSAFDASVEANLFFDKNDREANNRFIGDDGQLKQDFHNYEVQLAKTAATGTQYVLRHNTEYDFNNSPANRFFGGSYQTWLDAEVRQPLFQGSGTYFNRIAGPNSRPGIIDGVLVSRVRTDISLTDFEQGVRDLVSNVENAYWDLYFSYRDLEATIRSRDLALESWQIVQANDGIFDSGQEAQAREQYFRFASDVIDSLNGRLTERTRTNNGTTGGTFRRQNGVRVAERQLRLIMGVPINDGRLIRPIDEPPEAPMRFDWEASKAVSTARRPELRRQRWVVKQRELELAANRNFLLPRVDAVGRYRWRGFGDDLINYGDTSSAYGDFLSGDHQEWQLGLEVSVPIGFRAAHSAVRHAELQLARDRALLREQQRAVIYGLSNAVGEVRRAYEVKQAQFNRLLAVQNQVQHNEREFERGKVALDVQLEAQRRLLEASLRFFESEVEYALALKNVHVEQGTLLEYCNIYLGESVWPDKAYDDAIQLELLRGRPLEHVHRDPPVTIGP